MMLREKNDAINGLLRVLLACMILYYIPVSWFLAGQENPVVMEEAVETWETSMGGRESDVTISPVSLETPEPMSVPEPEEFSQPRMLLFSSYTIKQGDVVGEVAKRFGLNAGTLISLNNIKNTRSLKIGLTLKVPNQDGVYHTVKRGETLESITKKYKADVVATKVANELFSDQINTNKDLFVPGAVMPREEEQQINGDLFIWPVQGRLTSYYGYRRSPFGGGRSFHNGLDIAAPTGTPIRAAMAGRVSAVGYDNTFGNFVVITHQGGYRTLYGHMDIYRVKSGAYVNAGDLIGDVGNTGLSTGPHVHFTVYQNGATTNPRRLLRR
ncbi:MAG: M23 family metallopeptidase [Treponema sp.]|jgi:murein DD-endopeptidase MepM/ murein hydrolase activator NlpD|nr:M23 family metallopeptidase [Treponema sp.]